MSTEIQERLSLQKATIVQLAFHPGDDGITGVLVVKAPLTPEIAKILGCEERFFNLNERPYTDFQGRLTLNHVAKGCKASIGELQSAAVSLLPEKVWKFSIGLEADETPSVQLRMHFDSRFRTELTDMVHSLNKGEFPLQISSLQGNLFIEENSPETAAANGTAVDMSPAQSTIDEAIAASEVSGAGTLASARDIAGGTTDAAKKARRGRNNHSQVI
jgi:hypothetical protein